MSINHATVSLSPFPIFIIKVDLLEMTKRKKKSILRAHTKANVHIKFLFALKQGILFQIGPKTHPIDFFEMFHDFRSL